MPSLEVVVLLLLALAPALAGPVSWEPARMSEASVMMAGEAGACAVRIEVGADGVPTGAAAQSCLRSLHDEVEAAALQWRFAPREDGPFAVTGEVPVAPPALDLAMMAPGPELPAPPPADTVPVLRKAKAPTPPAALRSLLRDQGRRFAWERCQVQVAVGADGRVSAVRAVSCAELLWPAVEKAALRTTFDPAFKDGQPVASVADLELVVRQMP